MLDGAMSALPRLVTVLCLIQFGSIVGGFIVTRVFCRPYAGMMELRHSFPFPVYIVRSHGPWFLIAPAAWGIAAVARRRTVGREEVIPPGIMVAGLAFTIVVAVLFAWSSIAAFARLFTS
jgi:hypothetical protein